MNELAIPQSWEALKEQATIMVKSGFLPVSVNTPEKAIAIALTAKELGIGMMEGFRSINIIQGKPTISPQLMLALANRTGQIEDIEFDSNDERCQVRITRKLRKPHTEEFGVKEATALGLISRDNYRKQPAIMFRWRALAANLRVTFPDVVLGLYTPDEMGADVKTNSEGDMEVMSQDDLVNTGVRAPAGLKEMTPEQIQERIGEGNQVKKTPQGPFIFSPKQKIDEFQVSIAQKPENTHQIALEGPLQASEECINHDAQLELFRLIKEKGIKPPTFKAALEKEFGITGTKLIKKSDYSRIYEWILKHDNAEVGQ
jgi:hypothetical protein